MPLGKRKRIPNLPNHLINRIMAQKKLLESTGASDLSKLSEYVAREDANDTWKIALDLLDPLTLYDDPHMFLLILSKKKRYRRIVHAQIKTMLDKVPTPPAARVLSFLKNNLDAAYGVYRDDEEREILIPYVNTFLRKLKHATPLPKRYSIGDTVYTLIVRLYKNHPSLIVSVADALASVSPNRGVDVYKHVFGIVATRPYRNAKVLKTLVSRIDALLSTASIAPKKECYSFILRESIHMNDEHFVTWILSGRDIFTPDTLRYYFLYAVRSHNDRSALAILKSKRFVPTTRNVQAIENSGPHHTYTSVLRFLSNTYPPLRDSIRTINQRHQIPHINWGTLASI